MNKPELIVGSRDGEHIAIEIEGREWPESADYDDGNWLVAQVSVSAGSWQGQFAAALRAEEFAGFLRQVETLNERLDSPAEFVPMEPWIAFRLVPDELGHIRVEGEACDQPGEGNTLKFKFELDQTCLPGMIDQLKAIAKAHPVVGNH